MGRDLGRWGVTFERGAGPLLRTCQKESGSPWKGRSLACGVPGFGGSALSAGVWVGFRPSAMEGVSEGFSECRGGTLGGGVGVELGLFAAGGRLRGRGIRPRSPAGSPVPKWTGRALAPFPFRSFVPLP